MWQLICHQTYKYQGIPVDLSGYDNHGQSNDVDFLPDGAAFGSGALSFTRADSNVAIPVNSSWRPLTGLYVECVVRIAAYRVPPRVLIAGDGAFLFQISQAGLFATAGGSTLGLDVGRTVPLNTWTTVAFGHDGLTMMELYIDHQLVGRRTDLTTGVPGVAGGGISIGNTLARDLQHVFDGEIDEVKVWRIDPRAMWHDFMQRPINSEQAACWAKFTTALAQARVKDPDCARELMLGLGSALDRIVRAILAKGPAARAHFDKLHKRYLALWRGGKIHGHAMRQLISELVAWLDGLGIFPEKDAGLIALAQSPCFQSTVDACGGICDEDFVALINIVAEALGAKITGGSS